MTASIDLRIVRQILVEPPRLLARALVHAAVQQHAQAVDFDADEHDPVTVRSAPRNLISILFVLDTASRCCGLLRRDDRRPFAAALQLARGEQAAIGPA